MRCHCHSNGFFSHESISFCVNLISITAALAGCDVTGFRHVKLVYFCLQHFAHKWTRVCVCVCEFLPPFDCAFEVWLTNGAVVYKNCGAGAVFL